MKPQLLIVQGRIQNHVKEAFASFKKWNIEFKEYRSLAIIIQQINAL